MDPQQQFKYRAFALMRLGRFEDAEPMLVDRQRDLKTSALPFLADRGRLRLIELYERWGKPEEVRKLRSGAS